jgi:NADPH-dependent curcumin reductase CurA
MISTREIQLSSRPVGEPTPDNFRLVETTLPDPAPGEVAVRNLAMSVDPYMRGRMNDAPSYAPPWQLGEAAQGGAVGEVIAVGPGVASVEVGNLVVHGRGWRDHAVLPVSEVQVVPRRDELSPTLYLGALGMTGRTAYVGLFDIAGFQPGDAVFVSGAAGAVGAVVGQMARLAGASRVIGSAGSQAKIDHLLADVADGGLGFDAAFNYHDGSAADLLDEAAPDGIDVYFDNVGGEQLEAAIGAMNLGGRIAVCGQISGYNATEPQPGPRNLGLFIARRLTMRGFLVNDHPDLADKATARIAGWVSTGQLQADETIVNGLDNAVDAFIGMLNGRNTGKMIISLT